MRADVIKLLAGAKSYISGEEISGELGISRAAVWKNINMLKDDGGEVEAATNKGYRLVKLPDLLKPEYIQVYLKKPHDNIKWFESLDSTNTYLKNEARNGKLSEAVAVAEHQTGGKGRLGRTWASKAKEAIQMSFLLRPDIAPAQAPAFNLAVALGVTRAIGNVTGIDTKIKWPNDVVYGTKKLCGILTEMSSDMDSVEYIVCGAGTNVNQQDFPEEISQKATSLRIIKGETIDRVRLCAALIEEIEGCFVTIINLGMDAFMDEYCRKSAIMGNEICVTCTEGVFEGRCAGFGKNGELIVIRGDERRVFHAGEVSVRGVDDYV